MHYQRIPGAFPAVLVLLIGCGACSDRPGGADPAALKPAASPPATTGQDNQDVDHQEILLKRDPLVRPRPDVPPEDVAASGHIDDTDRFSSTIVVSRTAFVPEEKAMKSCSGVLLSPRLALTAANCMCILPKAAVAGSGMKSLADGLTCAASAAIKNVTFTAPGPDENGPVWRTRKVAGTVRVHPDFKLLLDEQGNVLSSEADLATILLKHPITDTYPSIEIPESDLEVGESLVMVDHGYDDWGEGLGDTRRFREALVTKMPRTGGWTGFAQAGPHTYRGGRGGPCLRESGDRAVVVGILNGTFARQPFFTSTYPYRLWLREEIQRAAAGGTEHQDARHRKERAP